MGKRGIRPAGFREAKIDSLAPRTHNLVVWGVTGKQADKYCGTVVGISFLARADASNIEGLLFGGQPQEYDGDQRRAPTPAKLILRLVGRHISRLTKQRLLRSLLPIWDTSPTGEDRGNEGHTWWCRIYEPIFTVMDRSGAKQNEGTVQSSTRFGKCYSLCTLSDRPAGSR